MNTKAQVATRSWFDSKRQPFFAVRIVLYDGDTGNSATRDYVRGPNEHMGKTKYAAWALGDMLLLTQMTNVTWKIEEIDFDTVVENRKYHHTTHEE